jgi:hypothetical protein
MDQSFARRRRLPESSKTCGNGGFIMHSDSSSKASLPTHAFTLYRRKQGNRASLAKVAVLEQAGLVRSSNTTAVVHGMLNALHGPTPPQPVKRYELTAEGQKYSPKTPGIFGQTTSFCYGDKTVDSIVKWTEPATMGAVTQTEVTYTYKFADLAPWAQRPDVQREFGDVRATVSGISKTNEIVDLQLTNQGWAVPGQ